ADRQRRQRQFQQGSLPAIQRATQSAQVEKLAAQDPSLSGSLTRGVVSGAIQALPYVAAGGGPFATAAGGALSELGEPSRIPLSASLGFIGGPGGAKVASQAIEKVLGKGVAQVIEAEAAAGAVQQTLPGMEPVIAKEVTQQVLPGMEAAIEK